MLTHAHRFLPFLLLMVVVALSGCSREGGRQQMEDYLNRAELYRDQGQYRAAMLEATNAMNAAPDAPEPALFMADIFNTLGAGRRASGLLEEFQDDHGDAVALALARSYLLQGRFLSAEEVLEPYEPGNDADRRLKALYLVDADRMRGRLDESEAGYRELLEQYPGDVVIRLRLAENLIFQGRPDDAETYLSQLRQDAPENPEAFQFSAIAALQRENYERAEAWLTEALLHIPTVDLMLPERAAILELLSETLTALGRTSEAMIYTRVLAEDSPESFEAQQKLTDAIAYAEAGSLDEAETLLRELLEENPESQQAGLLLGMVKLSQGDVEAAEPLLTQAVDVETAGTQAIQALAMAQAQMGNVDMALASLARSVRARPDNITLLSLYGALALNTEDHREQGYLALQKALARDPHRGGLRLALARYHFQQDEREQGMAQLRSAFNYQPANWPVTTAYVNELLRQGQMSELSQVIDTLKSAAPRARETAMFEAQYRFRDDQPEQAVSQLRELLQREPGYARAHGVLAQMYYEQGQTGPALASLERLLPLEPANDQALRFGVEIIRSGSADIEPQAWLASLPAEDPTLRANVTALRAMLYRDAGDLVSAVERVDEHEGQQSDYLRQTRSLVYRDRAIQLLDAGEPAQSRALIMDALSAFPNSRSLSLDLVRIDLHQERYREANAVLRDLRERFPTDTEVALMQARATNAQHGEAQAYRELRQVWDQRPDGQMAISLLNLARAVNPEAVPGILTQWAEAEPDSRLRLLYVAGEQQRGGDERAAIATYEQMIERNPEDPVALNNLAWLLKDRELGRATQLAERAVTLEPDSAPILDTYGWLLHLQGDRAGALSFLERAAELAPNSEEIQQNLQIVKASD
ncbi:tetratricopeptide repeat protein [Marinimicrobium alkaliphilum]|uniref:tetratricopeptide repeat protein n=1 Tax=Marinimicrobium alkaliphilum TaxID=2202654 RepID=UPI000DB97072|nr:tetratricopeptide repeat protein [Marinimicrobium alkaliphilum]